MKKFSSVVEKDGSYGLQTDKIKKPIFRSSAIFPVQISKEIDTRIIFMGYWILKKNIPEIGIALTLREDDGNVKCRDLIVVNSPRAMEIRISSLLSEIKEPGAFFGSIELEVVSTRDLVFPYPAFVIIYEGNGFKTCVHTTGRIYNDFDDFENSTDYVVPETGFDIHCSNDVSPFFSFVNGPLSNDGTIQLEVVSSKGQTFERQIDLGLIIPFATKWVNLGKEIPDLNELLLGEPGFVKITSNFKGFFTRMIAGNESSNMKSITHTYYDSSSLIDEHAYWKRQSDELYDSSVQIPIICDETFETQLVFYPIFSPSVFCVQADFYDSSGQYLLSINDLLEDKNTNHLNKVNFSSIIPDEYQISGKIVSCFLKITWKEGQKIPSRLKFGLNIGFRDAPGWKSCNICFGPKHGIVKSTQKKVTRKWSPLLDGGESVFILCNSTTKKIHSGPCKVKVLIVRKDDDAQHHMDFTIPEFGQVIISNKHFPEIRDFLAGNLGWIYAEIDNPMVDAWYFNFSKSGIVAGDHSF